METAARQRRRRGTGSVSFRSRDGLWCAQYDAGWADGKRQRRTLYAKTREAAEQALNDALRARGIETEPQEIPTRRPTGWEVARAKATHEPEDWALKLAMVGCCVYCGATDNLVQDHATPISRGGDNSIGNVVPACDPCNRSKGDSTAAEFLVDRILNTRPRA